MHPMKFGDHETNAKALAAGAAATPLPSNAAGETPKYVRVVATTAGKIAFGQSAMNPAGATFGTHVSLDDSIIVNVTGQTHVRNDATGVFVITALENDGGIG